MVLDTRVRLALLAPLVLAAGCSAEGSSAEDAAQEVRLRGDLVVVEPGHYTLERGSRDVGGKVLHRLVLTDKRGESDEPGSFRVFRAEVAQGDSARSFEGVYGFGSDHGMPVLRLLERAGRGDEVEHRAYISLASREAITMGGLLPDDRGVVRLVRERQGFCASAERVDDCNVQGYDPGRACRFACSSKNACTVEPIRPGAACD